MKQDFFETMVHMTTGMLINGYITFLIFGTTVIEAIGVTAIFFCASTVRVFAVRSGFRKYYENKTLAKSAT